MEGEWKNAVIFARTLVGVCAPPRRNPRAACGVMSASSVVVLGGARGRRFHPALCWGEARRDSATAMRKDARLGPLRRLARAAFRTSLLPSFTEVPAQKAQLLTRWRVSQVGPHGQSLGLAAQSGVRRQQLVGLVCASVLGGSRALRLEASRHTRPVCRLFGRSLRRTQPLSAATGGRTRSISPHPCGAPELMRVGLGFGSRAWLPLPGGALWKIRRSECSRSTAVLPVRNLAWTPLSGVPGRSARGRPEWLGNSCAGFPRQTPSR